MDRIYSQSYLKGVCSLPLIAYFISVVLYISVSYIYNGNVGVPLDDSYIHLVFARSISYGHWFEFNPGQPVSGSTSPLYSILVGILFVFTGPGIIPSIILGILFGGVMVCISAKLANELYNSEKAARMAGVLTAISYPLVWGALSGMEITLAAALTTSGLYYHIKSIRKLGTGYLSAFLLSLSILSRPESGVVAVILIADRFLRPRRTSRLNLPMNIFILIFLPVLYIIINYQFSGSILPNAFFAKSGGGIIENLITGDHSRLLLNLFIRPFFNSLRAISMIIFYNPFVALCAFLFILKWRDFDDYPHARDIKVIVISGAAIPAGIGIMAGTSFMGQYERYVSFMIPVYYAVFAWIISRPDSANEFFGFIFKSKRADTNCTLAAAVMILATISFLFIHGDLVNWVLEHESARAHYLKMILTDAKDISIGILSLSSVWLVLNNINLPKSISAKLPGRLALAYSALVLGFFSIRYANNVDNINTMQVGMAKWASGNIGADKTVALNDIGAFGFYTPRKILDIQGLISPEIIPFQRRGRLYDYITSVAIPDYLVIFREQEWLLRNDSRFNEIYSIHIAKNTICAGNELVVYEIAEID